MSEKASGSYILWLLALSILLALPNFAIRAGENPERQPFGIDDYFEIKRITELSLSSDGQMIAYAVESQSLEQNRSLRRVYVQQTTPGAAPRVIEDIQDARQIAWIAGKHDLAFLSGRDGTTQVYSYSLSLKTVHQHTQGDIPVFKYRFAPDGKSLAYITRDSSNKKPSLFEQFNNGDSGILIDSDKAGVYDFINPNWPDMTFRATSSLWVALATKTPFRAKIEGEVQAFHWSSGSRKLSVTYISDLLPQSLGFGRGSSLGVLDTESQDFLVVASARLPIADDRREYFAGGEWVPGEDKLIVRRISGTDSWTQHSDWTFLDLRAGISIDSKELRWISLESYFHESNFTVENNRTIYLNITLDAVRSVYEYTESLELRKSRIAGSLNGNVSLVQFSAEFDLAVFVNESLTRPPEIFVWREGRGARKHTNLNEEAAKKLLPSARSLSWRGRDGTTVQGWLLEPPAAKESAKPWPLVTYIHGGPKAAMPDAFAHLFDYWPYPFEVYALNGMAVFMPNYRGTNTFGRKFANPGAIDGEPVDDIISGIDELIERGFADPERLAITGHSHGAWLASLVMTRTRLFRAGSFAEGYGNQIVLYEMLPGWWNREIHDLVSGGSLYDIPERYLELSPNLFFEDQQAALLFEAGARSAAVFMLGYPKAARSAGMPTEFIVYPATGHTVTTPLLRRESATRNLDWLQFWLRGREDLSRGKTDQYRRWRAMCERNPNVC